MDIIKYIIWNYQGIFCEQLNAPVFLTAMLHDFFLFVLALETQLRILHRVHRCYVTELHPWPYSNNVNLRHCSVNTCPVRRFHRTMCYCLLLQVLLSFIQTLDPIQQCMSLQARYICKKILNFSTVPQKKSGRRQNYALTNSIFFFS